MNLIKSEDFLQNSQQFNINYEALISAFMSAAGTNSYFNEVQAQFQVFKQMLLDESADVPKIAITSYPRSGTHMLQQYIEEITCMTFGTLDELVVAESIPHIIHSGSKYPQIRRNNVVGFVNHFPAGRCPTSKFTERLNRTIILMRNPLDVFASAFNYGCTEDQTLRIKNKFHQQFPDFWTEFIKASTQHYKEFAQYWIQKSKQNSLPILFCTYEDVVRDKKRTLKTLIEFFLGFQISEEMNIMKRIEYISDNKHSGKVYSKRISQSADNRELYTSEHLSLIENELQDELNFFGFCIRDDLKHKEPLQYTLNNQSMLDRVLKSVDVQRQTFQFYDVLHKLPPTNINFENLMEKIIIEEDN